MPRVPDTSPKLSSNERMKSNQVCDDNRLVYVRECFEDGRLEVHKIVQVIAAIMESSQDDYIIRQ